MTTHPSFCRKIAHIHSPFTMKKFQLIALLLVALITISVDHSIAQPFQSNVLLNSFNHGYSIVESNGGFVMAGTTGEEENIGDIRILKTNPQGTPIWNRVIDITKDDRAFHMTEFPDGFALTGYVNVGGINRVFLLLTDLNGNPNNVTVFEDLGFGGSEVHTQGMHVIYTTANGDPGFVITGFATESYKPESDKSILVLRTDEDGVLAWYKRFNSPVIDSPEDYDMGEFVMEYPQGGGFYITGACNFPKPGNETEKGVLSMFVDYQGNLVWNNSYVISAASGHDELGASAILHSGSNTIWTLSNNSEFHNFYITQLNPSTGNVIQSFAFLKTRGENGSGLSLREAPNGNIIIGGIFDQAGITVGTTIIANNAPPFLLEFEYPSGPVLWDQHYEFPSEGYSTVGGFFQLSSFPVLNIYSPEFLSVDGNIASIAAFRKATGQHYDLEFIRVEIPGGRGNCESRSYPFTSVAVPTVQESIIYPTNTVAISSMLTPTVNGTVPERGCDCPLFNALQNWPKRTSGDAYEQFTDVVTDGNGSFWVTGTTGQDGAQQMLFEGTSSTPNEYFFVAKFTECNLEWINYELSGASGRARGHSLTLDPSGNVYVTGEFTGSLNFNSGGQVLTASTSNAFAAKYGPNGAFTWATEITGTGVNNSVGNDIEIDNAGNLFITGGTHSDSYYDQVFSKMFLTKMNGTNGAQQWTTFINALSTGTALEVDPAGNVLVAGTFKGTGNFGGNLLTSTTFQAFTAKYNTNGAGIWADMVSYKAKDIITDGVGNVYVTGSFIGPITFNNSIAASPNVVSVFLSKYNANGTRQWIRNATQPVPNEATGGWGLAINSNNEIFVTGVASSVLTFPNAGTLTTSSANPRSFMYFVAKYTTSGVDEWAIGTETNVYIHPGVTVGEPSIAAANGYIYWTGAANDGLSAFGPIGYLNAPIFTQLGAATITPIGNQDGFISRVRDNGNYGVFMKKNVATMSPNDGAESSTEDLASKVYPNPSNGELIIELDQATEFAITVEVTNLLGKQVAMKTKEALSQNRLSLDLKGHPAGVYFIRVQQGQQVNTHKVLLVAN